MDNVECFDVLDACNGWLRSIQIVQNAFLAGVNKKALIINSEFPMLHGGAVFPQTFELHSEAELAWTFASYTLGEGVSATLVSASTSDRWTFQFTSQASSADLCTIPMYGFERYSEPSERLARQSPWRFSAHWSEMFAEASAQLSALVSRLEHPLDTIRLIVPHAATQRTWDVGARALGVGHLLHHVYPEYGNLASASIPAGLANAIAVGRVRRGDRIVTCSASAGMSFGVASFVY
jgi:3-oxoacyl-[acyl-carrier-protein] synthase III